MTILKYGAVRRIEVTSTYRAEKYPPGNYTEFAHRSGMGELPGA